jgi:hypothetical protein
MMCPLSTQIDSKFRDDGSSVGNLQWHTYTQARTHPHTRARAHTAW